MSIVHTTPLPAKFYAEPYTRHRRAKLMLFNYCFSYTAQYMDMSYDDRMQLLQQLERSCYNYTISKAIDENIMATWSNDIFCALYHATCYKISSNTDASNEISNKQLISKILDKTIDINALPSMTSQELYPEQYTDILQRIAASKNIVQSVKTSAMYRCSKCKENKCTIVPRFNRSLDEGVNLTVTCMNCSFEWNA